MNPVLAAFARARPLLFDLASGVHPERWEAAGLSREAGARLAGCPRSRRFLSANLGWTGGAPEARWEAWNLSPGRREARALLSGEELWRGGLRFGAARFRKEIAQLVWRDDVKALKASVGEDAYCFAMRRAALIRRGESLDGAGSEGTLAENILASAILALSCWLASIPSDLAARARLKLPPGVDSGMAVVVEWTGERLRPWLAALDRVFAMTVSQ